MNQRQALMVCAYLGHLSEMRKAVQWYSHGGMKPAMAPPVSPYVAKEALRDASAITGMTRSELDAMLDRYDAELTKPETTLAGIAHEVTGDDYDMDPIGLVAPVKDGA